MDGLGAQREPPPEHVDPGAGVEDQAAVVAGAHLEARRVAAEPHGRGAGARDRAARAPARRAQRGAGVHQRGVTGVGGRRMARTLLCVGGHGIGDRETVAACGQ